MSRRKLERPLLLAGWGLFLLWWAAVRLLDAGSGAVLLGGGIILLLHQGARRLVSLPAEGLWLLLGTVMICAGLWRVSGAELQLLSLLLFAAGFTLLVSSWREFSKGR